MQYFAIIGCWKSMILLWTNAFRHGTYFLPKQEWSWQLHKWQHDLSEKIRCSQDNDKRKSQNIPKHLASISISVISKQAMMANSVIRKDSICNQTIFTKFHIQQSRMRCSSGQLMATPFGFAANDRTTGSSANGQTSTSWGSSTMLMPDMYTSPQQGYAAIRWPHTGLLVKGNLKHPNILRKSSKGWLKAWWPRVVSPQIGTWDQWWIQTCMTPRKSCEL